MIDQANEDGSNLPTIEFRLEPGMVAALRAKARLIQEVTKMAEPQAIVPKRSQRILDENPPDLTGIPTPDEPAPAPVKIKRTRKQAFHQYVEAQTAFCRVQEEPQPDPTTLEGKVALVQDALAGIPLNQACRAQLTMAFSAVLGVRITLDTKRPSPIMLPYRRFSIVVPTANSVGHNYQLGIPFMVLAQSDGIYIQCAANGGQVGNNMSRSRLDTRPATPQEIAIFIDGIADIERYFQRLNLNFVFADAEDPADDQPNQEEF
jgi:hypothetical protein